MKKKETSALPESVFVQFKKNQQDIVKIEVPARDKDGLTSTFSRAYAAAEKLRRGVADGTIPASSFDYDAIEVDGKRLPVTDKGVFKGEMAALDFVKSELSGFEAAMKKFNPFG